MYKKLKIINQRFLNANDGSGGNGDKGNDTNDEITLETLQNSVITLQDTVTKLQKKNEELTNQNHKLFLKATKEEVVENTKDKNHEYKEYVGEDFFNSLSNKQQKLLITILEGEDE